jgi:hypothetical protein
MVDNSSQLCVLPIDSIRHFTNPSKNRGRVSHTMSRWLAIRRREFGSAIPDALRQEAAVDVTRKGSPSALAALLRRGPGAWTSLELCS